MATFIVGSLVLGAFGIVGYKVYKQKKKGGGCCSGCSGCANTGCHHHSQK